MTKIEWTDETWNPVTGCTKVSQGCKNCYAERLAPKVFAGQIIGNLATGEHRKREFTDVFCHPERLDAPLHWKKPRRVFVNSMSDLFHEDVPADFIAQIFERMVQCPQHTFQILTKRAERMQKLLTEDLPYEGPDWPLPNVWLGVSPEDQPTANERIPLLLRTPAAVRFISYEPALGPLDLTRISLGKAPMQVGATEFRDTEFTINALKGAWSINWPGLDWVIAGGESGPNARPSHPDWFRSVRDQCAAAGIPYFHKQNGEWLDWKQAGASECVNKTPQRPSYKGPPLGLLLKDSQELFGGRIIQTIYTSGADATIYARVGKKAAGRLLDGRIHDEYP